MAKRQRLITELAVLLMCLLPLAATSSTAYTTNPSPNEGSYSSTVTIPIQITGCNGQYTTGYVILSIPQTPAYYTRMSWQFPSSVSEGIPGIFCYDVPFVMLNGAMIDWSQLWTQNLIPPDFSSSGSSVDFMVHVINYGDTVAFAFGVTYGTANFGGSIICYSVGSPFGSCTNGV